MLLRPFKGAEIGRWYRIVMSGTGTQAGEIPVRIAVIFETRLAGTGSVKTGPYQVCFMNNMMEAKFFVANN